MNNLINKYTKEIVNSLGNNLAALVLVGSYSRGEEIEGLSDIEFWAVVEDLSLAKKASNSHNYSLGFTTKKHLKQLRPYLYTIEVKKYGKVLYGDQNILDLIPGYAFEEIDLIDGFILLNNRIAEQLSLLDKIESGQTIHQYDFDKSYVQLVNVILILNKQYKSLYPEKWIAFQKIYKDRNLLNKAEMAFASIEELSATVIKKEDALKQWLEAREYFRKVWAEELEKLGGFNCWFGVLSSSRPMRLLVYREAVKLYFSDGYKDKTKRNGVISKWEKFVK